jgi:glycosyltransferase involved in cell wall biosynthesis
MDKANRVLAKYLVDRGSPVHLVAHFVDGELAGHPLITLHLVGKPLGSYFLGSPLLDRKGRAVWSRVKRQWPGAIIVANGGNCLAKGINWSHFVQKAWRPDLTQAKWQFRLRCFIEQGWERYRERVAYRNARLIITNSDMTANDVRSCLSSGNTHKVRRVYLGSETEWEPVAAEEKAAQRRMFEIPEDRKLALFVGALGADNRKGFDVILRAWELLSKNSDWDVDLWVAGSGPGLSQWEPFLDRNDIRRRVRILGYRNDIRELLACADLLVSAPRYEPYGLNVQEALGRGVAVITSTRAGIAERFPSELRPLLCENPDDPNELAQNLLRWRSNPEYWREQCAQFGAELCRRSWTDMAEEMVELIERGPTSNEPAPLVETCSQS